MLVVSHIGSGRVGHELFSRLASDSPQCSGPRRDRSSCLCPGDRSRPSPCYGPREPSRGTIGLGVLAVAGTTSSGNLALSYPARWTFSCTSGGNWESGLERDSRQLLPFVRGLQKALGSTFPKEQRHERRSGRVAPSPQSSPRCRRPSEPRPRSLACLCLSLSPPRDVSCVGGFLVRIGARGLSSPHPQASSVRTMLPVDHIDAAKVLGFPNCRSRWPVSPCRGEESSHGSIG